MRAEPGSIRFSGGKLEPDLFQGGFRAHDRDPVAHLQTRVAMTDERGAVATDAQHQRVDRQAEIPQEDTQKAA